MIINRLAKKGYIKRGYDHTNKNGKPHTVRVIAPFCFPEKCKKIINWVSTEQQFGQQTEQQFGFTPNNGSFSTEQQFDLLERNKKVNKNATPAPLPVAGQASALSPIFKTTSKPVQLSPVEFEESRQRNRKALLTAEAAKNPIASEENVKKS